MSRSNAPVVSTVAGEVRGVQADGVVSFMGIPYVRPPQRFGRAQPHPGWDGVFEATAFGAMAPQNGSMEAALYADTAPPQSEDCLTLNVFTPACDDASRPVMVWFHGGAYVTGSTANPFYDGSSFVRNGDVVVVTVNYRLGALGFTHLADLDPSFEASGNLGVLDQQAALVWVRDNIAPFGGNSGNVTIFGESAGGGSVLTQLALAGSRGLFHKAIAQSASFTQYRSRERATEAAEQLLTELGLTAASASKLRDVPLDELLAAQAKVETGMTGITAFAPSVDDDHLPDGALAAIAAGSSAGVPLLIGSNFDEMRMFTALDPENAKVDEDAVRKLVHGQVCHGQVQADGADALVDGYRAARPGSSWGQVGSTMATEFGFHQPAIRMAETKHGNDDPTWMYRFTWPSPAFGGILGACHALELPFVWNNLRKTGASVLTGTDNPSDDVQALADGMQQAWIAFARTGDPGWPVYDTATRATMHFDITSGVQDDPEGDLRVLWP
jgi:para-nitrobenzyl esterase